MDEIRTLDEIVAEDRVITAGTRALTRTGIDDGASTPLRI